MRKLLSMYLALVVSMIVLQGNRLAADCIECANGFQPMPGRFGAHSDGRRIIKIRIDSSWNSGGQTDAQIWNGVTAAIAMWNDAKDASDNKTGYYFVLDQGEAGADILIKKDTENACNGTFACSAIMPGNNGGGVGGGSIFLDENEPWGGVKGPNVTATDMKMMLGHEMSHHLGLTKQTCNGSLGGSVVSKFRVTTTYTSAGPSQQAHASYNGISHEDVQRVNDAMNDSSNCQGAFGDTSLDVVDEGIVGGDGEGEGEQQQSNDPEQRCVETWSVTYYFRWNEGSQSYQPDGMSWNYIVRVDCYPLYD